MGLHYIFCALAGIACHVQKDVDCTHYHEHDTFQASLLAWKELKTLQEAGAEKCGFNRANAWNEPKRCRKCFEDLNLNMQQAVLAIGTDAHCWDQSVEKFQGYSNCVAREPPDLEKFGKHCVTSWGVHNSSYKEWMYLTPHQKAGATRCNYHMDSWDGPADCMSCFEDLSLAKRKKLEQVGADHAACWDQLLKKSGVDCSRMMSEIPKFADRKDVYALFLKNPEQNPEAKYTATGGLRSSAKYASRWHPPATLSTGALVLLAVSFAVYALVQLRAPSNRRSAESFLRSEERDLMPAE